MTPSTLVPDTIPADALGWSQATGGTDEHGNRADRVLALLQAAKGNPQEVADAVLRTIETPAGQRKLRQRVGTGVPGVEDLNLLSERVQEQILAAFGMADLTKFAMK